MFLLALIYTAFAADYYLTTAGETAFGVSFDNARDICVQASTQGCGIALDAAFRGSTGATPGTCPAKYNVDCPSMTSDSSTERSFEVQGCTASLAMKAMSTVDCTIAIEGSIEGSDVKTYRFTIDPTNAQANSNFGASTGIDQKACGEAMLPGTCGGVDMASHYTTYGAVEGTCDRTAYPAECTGIDTSGISNVGPCGTGSFNWYFEDDSSCTAGATAVDTARTEANAFSGQVTSNCVDQTAPEGSSGVIGDMDCAKISTEGLCGNSASKRACPVTCEAGCTSDSTTTRASSVAGIVGLLFAGLVTLFAF